MFDWPKNMPPPPASFSKHTPAWFSGHFEAMHPPGYGPARVAILLTLITCLALFSMILMLLPGRYYEQSEHIKHWGITELFGAVFGDKHTHFIAPKYSCSCVDCRPAQNEF